MESIKENDPRTVSASSSKSQFHPRASSTRSNTTRQRRSIDESQITSTYGNNENNSGSSGSLSANSSVVYNDNRKNNLNKSFSSGNINTASNAENNKENNNSNSSSSSSSNGAANAPTRQTPITGSDKWLLANYEPGASIMTLSSNIELANLNSDGDYRLLIGTLGITQQNRHSKLRVYHGTSLQAEMALVDIPCAVAVVHGDKPDKATSIVIASGAYLFVYRNLRPFYKFCLPTLETNQIEQDAWNRFRDGRIGLGTLEELLTNLGQEIGRRSLTSRSKIFLNLDTQDRKLMFAEAHKGRPLKRFNVITCMIAIKKTLSDSGSPSCLVLGTESRDIYILEVDAFTILATATLPEVPVFVNSSGLYDVDFRLLWACRDGNIYLIKRGYTVGKLCIQLNSHPVGLIHLGSSIVVGTMDNFLHIFTTKGQRTWTMKQQASIVTMEAIFLERHGMYLVAVALSNRKILFYNDRRCVDILNLFDTCVALKFGRFGREDNTLICVTATGSLIVQILKRTSTFNTGAGEDLAKRFGNFWSSNDSQKLCVPKKTKLFVDQTMREREQFLGIHNSFQQELLRLKLSTARTYAESLKSNLNPLSLSQADSLKLAAKILGLGPVFSLRIELTNSSKDNFLSNLLLVSECDESIYKLNWRIRKLSCILPGATTELQNHIVSLSSLNLAGTIKIYICNTSDETPMLTAIINMPRSEIETAPEIDKNSN